MAKIMYELLQTFSCIWVFLLLGTCNGLGTFQIKHSPEYVVFRQEAQPIPSSEISPVVSQLLGFTVHQGVSWNGLKSVDFFKRPKANVLFTVEGGENIVNLNSKLAYGLTMDTPVIYTQRLVETLESGEFDHKPLIVDYSLTDFLPKLKLRYPEIFDSLPSTFEQIRRHRVDRFLKDGGESLNASKEIDMQFLAELEIASTIIDAIHSKRSYIEDNSPDYIHMRFTALRQLRQTYGDESVQVKAAAKALAAFVDDVRVFWLKNYLFIIFYLFSYFIILFFSFTTSYFNRPLGYLKNFTMET
ncbi:DgyrCDS5750 [Dimorphilus gyrociliatus]|uniref:DgyrCDS5750 n=1 Tax=Dimorphilus gyrociliatus TaxID=2664684 RepID=A0A7I8VMH0_9ANNE|nr:DgyrCDS5750 [Dimorphilus gyrociliatus]